MKEFLVAFLFSVLVSSCHYFQKEVSEERVAKVGDEVLLENDIPKFSEIESNGDTLAQRKLFIDNWVKEQLLLQKAMENLSEKQASFEKQLDNYRNSLLIYAFENLIVNQKLDTTVSNSELKKYYNNNSQNFKLRERIVKTAFVSTVANAPNKDSLEYWISNDLTYYREDLVQYCTQFAITCHLDTTMWVPFVKIKEIANLSNDKNLNLTRGKNVVEDSLKSLYLNLFATQDKGEIAPFSWVKNELKSIILNKRKIELIATVKQEVFESATLKEEYEIYE